MIATTIPATTTIGAVHLTVSDLERLLAYYTSRLGFSLRSRSGDTAHLGVGGEDLLVLTGDSAARRVRRATGLYHFAVIVPSRPDLGRVLQHLIDTKTPIDGASDHGVSEALYLSDPDGNGIEIYRDRSRSEWPHVKDGTLAMVSDPLDVRGLLAQDAVAGVAWSGLPAGSRIGHVHLQVSRIEESEQFYVGVLGFELMQRFGSSASFVSAGGYHHHLGFNTWAGEGAPAPPPGSIGLRHVEIRLPDADALERAVERVREAGRPVVTTPDGPRVTDPSGNHLLLRAQR